MSLFAKAESLRSEGLAAPQLEALTSGPEPAPEPCVQSNPPPSSPICTDWAALASNSKSDLDVVDLEEALFLFALNLVRTCPADDFMPMGHRHVPYWRKRLHPDAWEIVEKEIKQRLRQMKGQSSNGHDQASAATR